MACPAAPKALRKRDFIAIENVGRVLEFEMENVTPPPYEPNVTTPPPTPRAPRQSSVELDPMVLEHLGRVYHDLMQAL